MDVLPFDITTLKKLHGLWVGRYIIITKNVVEKYSYLETFINSYQSNCVHSCINTTSVFVNPLRPEDWYIRQWTGSSLIQVIACRLFSSDKWFPEPMVFYYELDPQGHTSVKLKKNSNVFLQENESQNIVGKWRPFCPGLHLFEQDHTGFYGGEGMRKCILGGDPAKGIIMPYTHCQGNNYAIQLFFGNWQLTRIKQ